MALAQDKVINRFIRHISDYEEGGDYYASIIPVDTQAYAIYDGVNSVQQGLYYVFGDGQHTYTEIRAGKGLKASAKEYPVLTSDILELLDQKADKDSVYTKKEIDDMFDKFHSFHVEVLMALPEVGDPKVLYLIPKTPEEEPVPGNIYKEYVWIGDRYELIGGSSGSIKPEDLTAEKVSYENAGYPDFKNVKHALDYLLRKDPEVVLSGGGMYEQGEVVDTVQLTWTTNTEVVSQALNQGIGELDPSLREYTVTNAGITTDTEFTIVIFDGYKYATSSTKIEFAKKIYWGVAPTTTISKSQLALFNSEYKKDRLQTRVFNCDGGNYFYFVIPTQYCQDISFYINDFNFSDVTKTEMVLQTLSGVDVEYSVFRCNNLQHGTDIEVEVV